MIYALTVNGLSIYCASSKGLFLDAEVSEEGQADMVCKVVDKFLGIAGKRDLELGVAEIQSYRLLDVSPLLIFREPFGTAFGTCPLRMFEGVANAEADIAQVGGNGRMMFSTSTYEREGANAAAVLALSSSCRVLASSLMFRRRVLLLALAR